MLLEVSDVYANYGSSRILQGTSLSVDQGEVFGLLGRNGMGKTTLIHTIAGFMKPRAGTVAFAGDRVSGMAAERIARRGVSLVPQGRRVFKSLSVGEHLEIAARPRAGGWSIHEVCERFPVLTDRWGQMAGLLSGGQQQMLAIARALVANGDLVLMDEPSEGLDPERVAIVAGVIRELRARGTATLLVEQKVGFVLDVADRIEVMDRGRTTFATSPDRVRDDPAPLYRELGFA